MTDNSQKQYLTKPLTGSKRRRLRGTSPTLVISKVRGPAAVLYMMGPKLRALAGMMLYLLNTARTLTCRQPNNHPHDQMPMVIMQQALHTMTSKCCYGRCSCMCTFAEGDRMKSGTQTQISGCSTLTLTGSVTSFLPVSGSVTATVISVLPASVISFLNTWFLQGSEPMSAPYDLAWFACKHLVIKQGFSCRPLESQMQVGNVG